MEAFTLISILTSLGAALLLGIILTRDSLLSVNQIGVVAMCLLILWSLCEVLLTTTTEPTRALILSKLAMVGWLPLAPILPHCMVAVTGELSSRVRQAIPSLYVLTGLLLLIDWATPWFHAGVTPTEWGWSFTHGPGFPALFVFQVITVNVAIYLGFRAYQTSFTEEEQQQARWAVALIFVALIASSLFDSILPILEISAPRIGHITITMMAGMLLWSFRKFGYGFFIQGTYAREILETFPNGVVLLHPDGKIRRTNDAFADLVGCTKRELENQEVWDYLPKFPASTRETVRELECTMIPSQALEPGERSRPSFPVAVSSSLFVDRTGVTIGRVIIVRDLREVESLQRQLVTSGRLAAVGELAAGVAHEINNPLSFMRSNLSLLKRYWERVHTELRDEVSSETFQKILDEGNELISETIEGTERTASIIQDIQRFSHPGQEEPVDTDLNELLKEVIRIASPKIRKRAELETDFGEIPFVPCSPQEMKQVFLNLIINAGHAVAEHGGNVQVTTQASGKDVLVHVVDNGSGMGPEVLNRIFDPFFTTKPVGQGTGLGLGITYQIVHKHGGEIVVDSEPGKGSSFCVRIPGHQK